MIDHGLFPPDLVHDVLIARGDEIEHRRSGNRPATRRRPGGTCASSSPPRPAPATSARSSPSPTPSAAPATRSSSPRRSPPSRASSARACPRSPSPTRSSAISRRCGSASARPRPTRPTGSSWASCSAASARAPRCPASSWRSTRGDPTSSCASRASSPPRSPPRRASIPVARVGAFLLAFEAYAIRTAAPGVDELRRWAGLAPDPAGERLAASPYLTLTPALVRAAGRGRSRRARWRFHAAPPPLRAVRPRGHAAARLPDLRLGRGDASASSRASTARSSTRSPTCRSGCW